MDNVFLRENNYKSGSELEVQSVKDILKISPCTIKEIEQRTSMTSEKVIECLKILASQKILARRKSRYFLVEQ